MSICTIIIKDEVNCRLVDIDPQLKQKLVNTFRYQVPYARHLPSVKLGRWDGMVNFFNANGTTYINMLEEILPIILDAGYEVELNDQRNYTKDFSFDKIDNQVLAQFTWPEGHRLANQPIILEDHQVSLINTFTKNLQSVQTAATGAGKSICTALLSSMVEPYGRSLVIVPSKSLVVQTEEEYKLLGLDVGVYFDKRKEWDHKHTISTWQSLNNLVKNDNIHDFIDDVVCVMVDEAHSAKGDKLKQILTGPLASIPIRWGLTGTIPKEKFESQALKIGIGNVVGEVTAAELQKKGFLANCDIHIKQFQDDMLYNNYQRELNWVLTNEQRLDEMASMIESISNDGNTLVLVPWISTAKNLALRLPPERVAVVTGSVKNEKRREEYAEMSEQDNKIIIATYGVAAVGINIPRIFNMVLVEPGKSFVRVIQSIGRSLRMATDKDHAHIYDITSNCKFSKRHLTQRKRFYKEAEYAFDFEKIHYR